MVNMKVKNIYPGLYFYSFPNQYELASTFIRLQEFYESQYKQIRGKYFTLEKFMDMYTKDQKDNKFTYFSDWDGFNVPGHIVQKFMKLYFDKYTEKEDNLLAYIEPQYKFSRKKYYIIGIVNEGKDTIKHEIAHALYYLNEDYRSEMCRIINNMPRPMKLMAEKYLIKLGYCKAVIKDELQAYFATGIDKGMICIWHHLIFQSYILKIKQIFKKYYEEIENA